MPAYDVRGKTLAAKMLNTIANGGKGQTITLTSKTPGAYDPATGAPAITTTTQTGSGVVMQYPISIRVRGGSGAEKGSLVMSGNKNLMLSPNKTDGTALTTPAVNDIATIGGVDYTITAVAPCAPAGTVIYFDCDILGAP